MKLRMVGGALGLVALFVALFCSWTPRSSSAHVEEGRGMLLAGIDLNAIDGLSVSNASHQVDLLKQEGRWGVASSHDRAVDFPKLALALRSAARLELKGAVSESREDAAKYGFDAEKTIRLQVSGSDVIRLDVGGAYAEGESIGRYVRKNGSSNIYWVADSFESFGTTEKHWIRHDLVEE